MDLSCNGVLDIKPNKAITVSGVNQDSTLEYGLAEIGVVWGFVKAACGEAMVEVAEAADILDAVDDG